jgi:hypothetical protein
MDDRGLGRKTLGPKARDEGKRERSNEKRF